MDEDELARMREPQLWLDEDPPHDCRGRWSRTDLASSRTHSHDADSLRRCGSTGSSRCPAQVSGGVSDRVADVDHAVVELSVVKQLEVESYASRQRRLAAADEDRAQQQHALVDQAVPEGLGRYPRASDAHVRARGLLEPSYRLGLELSLDPRARGRYVGQ